jgi:hypothetical protein
VNISDATIERLRNANLPNLVMEKVDETKPAHPPAQNREKAVYVVNPSHSEDSRLVADVMLNHR